MDALDAFIGKWQEEKKEGFEDLAQAIGLAAEKVAMYNSIVTVLEYCRGGDQWTISVGVLGGPTQSFHFKLGEPYDSASVDGSPLKSVIVADGDKFHEKHTGDSLHGATMEITRHVEGEFLIAVTSCAGKSMTSTYKRAS